MLYPYITLGDGTEILHSQIIEEEDMMKVEVHFERPLKDGFAVARCELPTYKWIRKENFSEEDIALFTEFLENNASLIYKYARSGGISIA